MIRSIRFIVSSKRGPPASRRERLVLLLHVSCPCVFFALLSWLVVFSRLECAPVTSFLWFFIFVLELHFLLALLRWKSHVDIAWLFCDSECISVEALFGLHESRLGLLHVELLFPVIHGWRVSRHFNFKVLLTWDLRLCLILDKVLFSIVTVVLELLLKVINFCMRDFFTAWRSWTWLWKMSQWRSFLVNRFLVVLIGLFFTWRSWFLSQRCHLFLWLRHRQVLCSLKVNLGWCILALRLFTAAFLKVEKHWSWSWIELML